MLDKISNAYDRLISSYRRSWIFGILIGIAMGLIVALVMSYLDWQHNPEGIFHNEIGTNWGFVLDTAVSWFVPVALVSCVLSIAVLICISRWKKGGEA